MSEKKLSEMEPRPCPFCGGDDLQIFCGEWFYVVCGGCQSHGTRTNQLKYALEAWNRRPKA